MLRDSSLEIIPSSGNVFKDLGKKNAANHLAKAELASRINDLVGEKKYSQQQAGEVLGINQPKVSALMNGRLEGFSMERLIYFLTCLDQDVKILITEKPKKRKEHGKLQVAFA